MKLYIEKKVKVLTRNILGEPIQTEDWYYIYFIVKNHWWSRTKKQYLNLKRRGFFDGRIHPVNEPDQTFNVSFSDNVYDASVWTKEEAEYLVSNIQSNPNKYILL